MKKILITLLLGVFMGLQASALTHQEINQAKVPVIYEEKPFVAYGVYPFSF